MEFATANAVADARGSADIFHRIWRIYRYFTGQAYWRHKAGHVGYRIYNTNGYIVLDLYFNLTNKSNK